MAGRRDMLPVPMPVDPIGARPDVRRTTHRAMASIPGVFVVGERGAEAETRARASVESLKAQHRAFLLDRRARGIDPNGTLFEGEDS